MKRAASSLVYGQSAQAPRLTPLGAALVAAAVALPGGAIIALVEAIWF